MASDVHEQIAILLYMFLSERALLDIFQGEAEHLDESSIGFAFFIALTSTSHEVGGREDIESRLQSFNRTKMYTNKRTEDVIEGITSFFFEEEEKITQYKLLGVLFGDNQDREAYNASLSWKAFQALDALPVTINMSFDFETHLGLIDLIRAQHVSESYYMGSEIDKDAFRRATALAIIVTETTNLSFMHVWITQLLLAVTYNDLHLSRRLLLEDAEAESVHVETVFKEQAQEQSVIIDTLQKEIAQIKQANENLIPQERLTTAQSENVQLQKRIKELERTLQEKDDHSQEVYALRDFVFQAEQEESESSEAVLARYKQELGEMNLVFVGGHDNWVKYMTRALPNAIFLKIDAAGRDFSAVQKPNTHVFINTLYNNHGYYYKVIKNMQGTQNELYYIRTTNADVSVDYIYKQIQFRK